MRRAGSFQILSAELVTGGVYAVRFTICCRPGALLSKIREAPDAERGRSDVAWGGGLTIENEAPRTFRADSKPLKPLQNSVATFQACALTRSPVRSTFDDPRRYRRRSGYRSSRALLNRRGPGKLGRTLEGKPCKRLSVEVFLFSLSGRRCYSAAAQRKNRSNVRKARPMPRKLKPARR
jgi:hypothetical protein